MDDSGILKKIETDAVSRYSERFSRLGVTPQTLGWGSIENQVERFKTIIDNMEVDNKTIMDIGCGFADFYKFLKDSGKNVNYIGIDINDNFIELCKKKYPDGEFYKKNILLDSNLELRADIVVSLGTLNFKLENGENIRYSEKFIKSAFEIAEEKLVVDFLSDYSIDSYPREDFVYYHSPTDVMELCLEFTNNIKLIHDYKPIPQKEFMVILSK